MINRYVNPTNVCVLSCSFCDFARKKGEAGAFENSIEDVLAMIKPGTREAHIVGGHHPDWPFEYYERLIGSIHAARPETQIKAFTAAEIDYFWRRWKIEPREALTRLKAAGLHSMPGGGAEIFSKRLQKLLHYTGKADADRWCEIHGIAHSLGLKTNATMLYGHVETHARSASITCSACGSSRTRSGGFITFIPLSYQVGTTKLVPRQTPPTDDLRTIAVSRLLLDNFPHIEAYWVMMGEETASLALHFGASDVNGTLEDEKIAHMRPRRRARPASRSEQILRMIADAGKTAGGARRALQRRPRSGAEPMLRIGRIPYLNCEPFFARLGGVELVALNPRRLGEAVAAGELDAGPLSLVDQLRLEGPPRALALRHRHRPCRPERLRLLPPAAPRARRRRHRHHAGDVDVGAAPARAARPQVRGDAARLGRRRRSVGCRALDR